MAKYRHRIFEMYEQRAEAVQAMTPRSKTIATEATPPESWTFTHLDVLRSGGIMHVQFKEPLNSEDAAASGFREDLTRLADLLGRDSKVLLDFTGVPSFDAASIGVLVQFSRTLQTKGSRFALCCLEPATRAAFFVTG